MQIRIPDTFERIINALPLKFQTVAIAHYMKCALTLSGHQQPELLSWEEPQGDGAFLTYSAYTYGGWIFLPLNAYDEPWSSKKANASLGWGIFQNPSTTDRASLEEAIEQFNLFHEALRANIGLNKPNS